MNLKDLSLKDLVKIGVGITAMLFLALTLNLAISFNNTTVINNYIQETEKKFQEQKQESLEIKEDIASTNQTVNQVQENVSKIKTDQTRELALQQQILREVD